ncbi:MAG: hypothetical protein NE334_18120 [Lentisphaeraceae bacterium]|nr:hypothetical protein [Lentisphaeraceae bacterium]
MSELLKPELFFKSVLKLKEPFCLDEVDPENHFSEELLETSELFFWVFDNDGSRQFISKQSFFEGTKFRVHLEKNEIEEKYLVAPARFLPFVSSIPKLIISGKEVPVIRKSIKSAYLKKVFALDEGQEFIRQLQTDQSRQLTSLEADFEIETSVYDLSAFSDEIQNGVHLSLIVKEGTVSGELLQSEDINLGAVKTWCEQMEKTLLGVFKEFGPFYDISQQLELAYFYGPNKLRSCPSLAIRDFIKLSAYIESKSFVFRKILWFKDRNPLESAFAIDKATKFRDALASSLEVDAAFYSLLPVECELFFSSVNNEAMSEKNAPSELQVAVNKFALWVKNSQDNLSGSELAVEEMLILESVFLDLQYLCQRFLNPALVVDPKEFLQAVELNTKMLQEVCELLQFFYFSDSCK